MTIAHPAHRPHRTTRHHRVDERFITLLEEDFRIDAYSLNKAFVGVPPAAKKEAIALCEWAILSAGGDPERAGDALRAWANKRGKGAYSRRLVDAPPMERL
jgi:hypothetical protein